MKRFILVLLIVTISSCSKKAELDFQIQDHIPENSEVFLLSPDLEQFLREVRGNKFLSQSKFALKKNITGQLEHLSILNLKNETGISFSNLSTETPIYTIITIRDSSLIPLDSARNRSIETFKEGNLKYKRVNLNENKFFLLETGNTVIISNSKQNILNSGNQEKLLNSPTFNKAWNASDRNKTSIFLNHALIQTKLSDIFQPLKFPGIKSFAEWSVLDIDISESNIKLNGISLNSNDDNILNRFKNIDPQQSEIGKICPGNFISFYSVGYSDFDMLYKNGRSLKQDSIPSDYPGILKHARESASIVLTNGNILALNINEMESAKETLAGLGIVSEDFRGSAIIELNEDINFQKFFPGLMTLEIAKFYTVLENFVIFSSNPEVLKSMITAFQNSDTLNNKQYFTDLMTSLSSDTSMLFVVNSSDFAKKLDNGESTHEFKFNKNSLAALQVINEVDYAHLHVVLSNSEKAAKSNGAEQSSSIKIDSPISKAPVFFKNHRTDQMDIAVQDENNELYLISNKGNVFWKKSMDSQITSPIYQVDLFKNGNQQMAFSTGYHMEVLDRTGKKLKGYPIKFNQLLTQPLSVFDYDNNRTYRFVLTQNKKVYMVGPKGNAIKGFSFENAGSEISKAPKHIRLGTKDYILIAEETGKLHILSRQGTIRVPVSEKIDFSENEWFGYQNSFVSTNPEQNLIKISQNGTVSSTDLGLAENNRIVANRNNLVYLNENELSINSKTIDLDFGLYTDPQLFTVRNRTLIAITDTQTQKVYIFNDKAELLEGFPVYGTSQVDIANADLDSKLELLVKGEDDEILLYEF
ncbi:DUF3352 domain-containing protein [Christiangramia echinicola]|uniref:DUF3352 domain-containing protein n=1 Tax=Christiangramia echinicola TaxID=279359 RepID=UPI0003F89692|nr:DUF3352 domain-containing protein [Christiangramia echinicola]